MRYLKAFVLGSIAAAVLVGVVVAVLSAVATAGSVPGVRIALGPLLLVAVRRAGEATETTVGPAIVLVTVVGGLVNAAALALLTRRRGGVER